MVGQFKESLLADMLPLYYNKYFPQNIFCRWLTCGSSPQPLANRELSFTLADDVYLRYLSVNNQKELQTLFVKKCPHKLDIGAVYNTKPSVARHDSVVLARELVFDIDLTDYDEVRTCCKEAKVCEKCWKYMVIACEIIDKALKDDFGFQSILWVFSGRRGIHCWVSDFEARTLDSPGRGAVADYLCLIMGGENQSKKVNLGNDNLHTSIRYTRSTKSTKTVIKLHVWIFSTPAVLTSGWRVYLIFEISLYGRRYTDFQERRALEVIDKYFEELLNDQEFFATSDGLKAMLKLIPDETLRSQVEKKLEKLPESSLERWKQFINVYESYGRENGYAMRKMKYLVEEIKIQYCYPRLDVNVTKGFNHLLKSPFSIHPKTGKVSVVFKPSHARKMKLDEIPSIHSLLDDSTASSADHQNNMKTSVKYFQDVVFSLEKLEAIRRKNDPNISLDF